MVKMMRAIDVDKLEWFQVTFGAYQQKAIMILKPHICDLDIIDAEPVRHGRWEKVLGVLTPGGDPLVRCPYCKSRESEHLRGIETHMRWNYCPVCGAKMDLE